MTGHDAVKVASALTLPPQARIVYNPAFKDGQATSLAAAIHALDDESEAAVILMADQPGVDADVVRALVERFRATRRRSSAPMYADGPGPSLLSREIYAEAGHLHGDVGARILIASHPEWVEEVPVDADAPLDIDVPDDLAPRSVQIPVLAQGGSVTTRIPNRPDERSCDTRPSRSSLLLPRAMH